MIVMPANNTHWLVHYWAGRYGNLGHLYSPDRYTEPMPHLPYVLDNGAWGSIKNGLEWDPVKLAKHFQRYASKSIRPQWVVCPDVVGDAAKTFELWSLWHSRFAWENVPVFLAVQDGMTVEDVERLAISPDGIFVGGSTEWKWQTARHWCANFKRVHVARVNGLRTLKLCKEWGAESCDGTGWFMGRSAQLVHLGEFLSEQAGIHEPMEVERVVYESRLKNKVHGCLPLEVA